MKVRLPYFGTIKCELTDLFLNKPDIIIHDNKQGTCTSIYVAIPGDRNVIKKESEKILKYKDLIYKFSACGM